MKHIALLIGFVALSLILMPAGTAQDVKKDDIKKEDKKDEKKPDEKKPEKKPAPEKLVFSKKFMSKIMNVSATSSREFTVEVYEPDQTKIQAFNTWMVQRQGALTQQQFDILKQKDFKARLSAQATYQKALYEFEVEKVKKSSGTNLMSAKPLELRAAENAKVRSLFPPVEFDELGFQKKWTKKELEERRDNSGLPGFAVEFDAIKSGQFVEVYLKGTPMVKGPKKKGPDDDDPGMPKGQEYILIIIRQESGGK